VSSGVGRFFRKIYLLFVSTDTVIAELKKRSGHKQRQQRILPIQNGADAQNRRGLEINVWFFGSALS
jgi:hypothetical protein